jgi:dihydrofolate reductase
MILSAIVALDQGRGIGRGNALPWHLPADLKFFKNSTLGKPVLMGRNTYLAIGSPLPGRPNVVVTSHPQSDFPEGVIVTPSLEAGIEAMEQTGAAEGMVIGGAQIFIQAMHLLDKIYATQVHTVIADADTFFPEIDHAQFKLVKAVEHPADDKHAFSFTFQELIRISF